MRLIDADGSYTLNASDNTDYSLCFGGGIISAIDKHGHVVCEFFADDAPTIDAEPVRHGHWINAGHDEWSHYRKCSVCGKLIVNMSKTNYCPDCGAKMDGKENGNEQR